MSEIPFYPNEVDEAERIAALESELERIRPVYEAACAWREASDPDAVIAGLVALGEAVDVTRTRAVLDVWRDVDISNASPRDFPP